MAIAFSKNDPARARQFFADKLAFTTGPVELARAIRQGENIAIIDVREAEDFRKGHIPGAVNLPHDKWPSLEGLRKDALNVLCCYTQQCHLAAAAAAEFAGKGYSVMEMDGGFDAWKQSDLEIESEISERTGKRQISVTA
jgi:rhodanese-related sulfurtransferase